MGRGICYSYVCPLIVNNQDEPPWKESSWPALCEGLLNSKCWSPAGWGCWGTRVWHWAGNGTWLHPSPGCLSLASRQKDGDLLPTIVGTGHRAAKSCGWSSSLSQHHQRFGSGAFGRSFSQGHHGTFQLSLGQISSWIFPPHSECCVVKPLIRFITQAELGVWYLLKKDTALWLTEE